MRAVWQGVVCGGDFYGASFHVLNVFPAGDAFFGVAGAGEADADESFAVGEDDATVDVVPSVAFVLLHDGELDAVEGDEFIEGEAEG